MRWTCLLALVSVACFSESDTVPPRDGGEGTTEITGPSGSTSSPTATQGADSEAESTTRGGGQSAGSEAGSTAATSGVDSGSTSASETTGVEDSATSGTDSGSTSAMPTCSCGWDPSFDLGDGTFGAYACTTALAGTMAPGNDPPMACPEDFTAGSLCQGQPVGLAGCCDASGNVAFCIGGGPAGGIDCADEKPPQSCND
ncbi:MAG: hypothetical protein AAF721_15885 [Myxococcota bacterium]